MIRGATLGDLPRILDLGEMLHAESPQWSRLNFNRERAGAFMRFLMADSKGAVFVAERNGVITGGIAAFIERHWSSDDLVAQEVSLFTAPDARGSMAAVRLITTMVAWAELRGAIWLHAGTSTGIDPERTAGLYERLGFTRCAIGLEIKYGNR